MPLNIRNDEVNRLAEKVAALAGTNKTEAVKQALQAELVRLTTKTPLRVRLKALQDRMLSYPPTGLEADKAFFDELSGEE